MARFVISVGGTGQHIALALVRLVQLGALRPDIKLIAIDPDTETPLPKLLEAPAGMSGARHPLQGGRVFAPFDVARVGEKPFERMFVDVDHPLEKEFFEAMFDASASSIPIYKGMFGTPCVGAAVFAEGCSSSALQDLLKPVGAATEVFICGSVVGGTGAGVIHKLIGEVRREYPREMFGIFMLPWFSLPTMGAANAITDARIQRNAKHGIKYFYEHTLPNLSTSLLVGYPTGKQTPVLRPLTLADGDMGEHPHYLHLVAARALVELPQALTANRGVKAYATAHDDQNEAWLLDDNWEGGESLRRKIRGQRLLLNLLTFVLQNSAKLRAFYQAGFVGQKLLANPWGSDLHASIDSNTPGKGQQGTFVDALLQELEQIRIETEFCVSWAERIFPSAMLDIPSDILMDELRKGSEKGADSQVHWPAIAKFWQGTALLKGASGSHSAAQVARHHAKVLLQASMKG